VCFNDLYVGRPACIAYYVNMYAICNLLCQDNRTVGPRHLQRLLFVEELNGEDYHVPARASLHRASASLRGGQQLPLSRSRLPLPFRRVRLRDDRLVQSSDDDNANEGAIRRPDRGRVRRYPDVVGSAFDAPRIRFRRHSAVTFFLL
jgi:hypothetical protein